ncbi:MAG TPA: asparagine synthase C-terminal domain-containing protein [Candidatus Krumholzibacteria bacterium]|nr:asparagine synthase C-terminal domain-containing protein [Candidatus Krumholzibacteria bacterium]
MAGCAAALRDAFVAACRARHLDAHDHVLSLSGGIDSRAVGAGMRAAFGTFSAVTFVAPGSSHADERDVASRVARALGADWRAYEFDHTDPSSIDGIIRLKLGLNPVDVAFGLDYVRRVQADHAQPVALWTGEGADKMLCEHRAIPRRPNTDELVRFIVEKNAVFAPARVRALTGVHEDDLLESIRAAVLSAGDVEPDDAYVHFLLAERVVRWHTEGEDRHRTSVWPIAPYFARDFFELARAIPAQWKHGRRVYRAFLEALAPDVAALPLAGGHAAPASTRFALEYALRETLRNNRYASSAYAHLRRRRASARTHNDPWRDRLAALREASGAPACFDAAAIDDVLSGRAPASSYAMAVLLTTVLAVRHIEKDRPKGGRDGMPAC